jgi:hypothetical protein
MAATMQVLEFPPRESEDESEGDDGEVVMIVMMVMMVDAHDDN